MNTKKQSYEIFADDIRHQFLQKKAKNPNSMKRRLEFGWNSTSFGIEPFEETARRLSKFGVNNVQLLSDVTQSTSSCKKIKKIADYYGVNIRGIDGDYNEERDLSVKSKQKRNKAMDYVKASIDICAELGGDYLLVAPGALGRMFAEDEGEFDRIIESLLTLAPHFKGAGIICAIEPMWNLFGPLIHTIGETLSLINAVNDRFICGINADIHHIMLTEGNVAKAVLECGNYLTDLHVCDSNRGALGTGQMDIDTIIMALYLMDYNNNRGYVTAEPIDFTFSLKGDEWDNIVKQTVSYFTERENYLLNDMK